MSLTRETIQKFSDNQPQQAPTTQSEYELSEYQSEYSLMSNMTANFTSKEHRQKAKIINKKVFYKKLEEFHKQTFHTLLQQKGKQCHVCQSEACKMGKMNKLPTVQMIFANVFASSKIIRNNKSTVSHIVNQSHPQQVKAS